MKRKEFSSIDFIKYRKRKRHAQWPAEQVSVNNLTRTKWKRDIKL